ncbi:VanZ family protein [Metabacillus litoralis]|uniref:VanZ family protein n=1 Tax=Metabacillus litoralis TaxID=152268 RepID=A0A5C6V0V8_9BACI|nr:VanZ family protein [Metabacillus litoralis]TXC78500.1 VanZ family protein [Metabacillus litoralis]
MRICFFWSYIAFLFIATCTENLSLFLAEQDLIFHFNGNPPVREFLNNDFDLQDPTYVSQKLGHIVSFFILGVLAYSVWRSVFVVAIISLAVALSTEVAQLFFSRSGRLLDVGYDMAGASLFVVFVLGYRFVELVFKKMQIVFVDRR